MTSILYLQSPDLLVSNKEELGFRGGDWFEIRNSYSYSISYSYSNLKVPNGYMGYYMVPYHELYAFWEVLGTTKHCCAMAKARFGISNLRVFLHKISENLVSDEVASLKFLCCDILTKARLEKIINARELFVAIGEVVHDEEEQLQYFKFLFETIGRFDLKSKILEFEESRKGREH